MPVQELATGTPIKFLDALTSTSDTLSSVFALPSAWSSLGRPLTWQMIADGTPSAVSLALQGALNNVDAEFKDLDTSTTATGEMRHVSPLNVRFLRVRQVSRTGGTSITVTVLV